MKKEWRPINLRRGGPAISHLFFADDLVLFAEVSLNQASIIKYCLEVFCKHSGQKVSVEKTKIFFSKNVNHTQAKEISDHLGFSTSANLGKYLGIPLHHDRIIKATYNHVLEQIQNKFSSWGAKTLAMAGRITLSKAVLASMPLYSM